MVIENFIHTSAFSAEINLQVMAPGISRQITTAARAVLRTYDAENRMTKETQANSYVAGTYTYDGDGRRVKRIVGSTETWQVYGIGGELLAEYAANGNPLSPQKEYAYRNGQLLITTDAGANAPAPSGLTATPPSSGASINLSWSASSGATNYRIERKGAGGSYNLIGTTSLTTLTDNTAKGALQRPSFHFSKDWHQREKMLKCLLRQLLKESKG
jgi:YD repeat-containing protein